MKAAVDDLIERKVALRRPQPIQQRRAGRTTRGSGGDGLAGMLQRVDSPVGRRYLTHREGGLHVLLLARPTKVNKWGGPQSFTCLGPAQYVEHTGIGPSPSPGGCGMSCPLICTVRRR